MALLVLLCVGAAYLVPVRGLSGRVLGALRTVVLPRDLELLSFFGRNSEGVVALNAPLLRLPPHNGAHKALEELRQEVLETSGIDVVMDVDALAVAVVGREPLFVVRGRFSWSELQRVLGSKGYKPVEDVERMLCSGSRCVAFVRPYLVLGSKAQVRSGLQRNNAHDGMDEDHPLVGMLDGSGWRVALLGAWQKKSASPVEGARDAVASLASWPSVYTLSGSIGFDEASIADRYAAELRRVRDGVVANLRKGGANAQRVADALEAAWLEANGSRVNVRVTAPIDAFTDDWDARDAVTPQLGLALQNAQEPAAPPPRRVAVSTQGLSQSEVDILRAVSSGVCKEKSWLGCSHEDEDPLMDQAVALRMQGMDTPNIRAALRGDAQAVAPNMAAGRGRDVRVLSATVGANCGLPTDNLRVGLEARCREQTHCDLVVDHSTLGMAGRRCSPDVKVLYVCGDSEDIHKVVLPSGEAEGRRLGLDCR